MSSNQSNLQSNRLQDPAKVIAIDGPSGSGKSSIAKELAQSLGILYIDTGAMFRGLAYYCKHNDIAFVEGEKLNEFLHKLDFEYSPNQDCLIKINGQDLTQEIRLHEVSKYASQISQLTSVRTKLLEIQRELAKKRLCVMEGRDIGTIVFPNAFCKFFVTASVEIRAQRRFDQLMENSNNSSKTVNLEQVIKDVKKRDELDSNREIAPLKQAEDAELIDTSDFNFSQVLALLENKVKQKAQMYSIGINEHSN